MRDLPVPPDTLSDANAREMIRVWIANNDLHVSLNLGMYADDPDGDVDEREAWGQILADTIRHVAHGLHQSHGWRPQATTATIRTALLEHLRDEDADSKTHGGYVDAEDPPD